MPPWPRGRVVTRTIRPLLAPRHRSNERSATWKFEQGGFRRADAASTSRQDWASRLRLVGLTVCPVDEPTQVHDETLVRTLADLLNGIERLDAEHESSPVDLEQLRSRTHLQPGRCGSKMPDAHHGSDASRACL